MRRTGAPWQFRRADLFLIVILAAAGVGISVFAAGSLQSRQAADQVVITADGSAYGSWPLSEDTTIDIRTSEGTNQVIIQDGTVWMQHASCKNQICVETGRISRPGQLIVCLPNRVVVEIKAQSSGTGTSTEDEGFDAVAR